MFLASRSCHNQEPCLVTGAAVTCSTNGGRELLFTVPECLVPMLPHLLALLLLAASGGFKQKAQKPNFHASPGSMTLTCL